MSGCCYQSCAPYYSGITNVQVPVVITSDVISYSLVGQLITLTFTITNNTSMPLNSPLIINPTNGIAQIVAVGANVPVGGSITRTRYYYITSDDLSLNGINFSATSYLIVAGKKALLSTTPVTVAKV